MTHFAYALGYVMRNEGGWSNDPADRGGRTMFGIAERVARENGYDVTTLTREQAAAIYRRRYWHFDTVRDRRVAAKTMDICVNVGLETGIRLLQRSVGVVADGVYGPRTDAALHALSPEHALARLSVAVADYYVDIVIRDPTQTRFLLGWCRRAVRLPDEDPAIELGRQVLVDRAVKRAREDRSALVVHLKGWLREAIEYSPSTS